MPTLQRRTTGKNLESIDIGHHGHDRRLLLILGAGREHAEADAPHPVGDAGAFAHFIQNARRMLHQGVGEVEEAQPASGAPEALGAGRNAFAPRGAGRMAVGKHGLPISLLSWAPWRPSSLAARRAASRGPGSRA